MNNKIGSFIFLITTLLLLLIGDCGIRVYGIELDFNEISNEENGPTFLEEVNLPESDYSNCGKSGNITRILMARCKISPCHFYPGEQFDLEYDYITAIPFASLDFRLRLIDTETQELIELRFNTGTVPVKPNELQTSFTIITLKSSIPSDRTWYMEISREFHGVGEICARVETLVSFHTPPPPTTDTTTEPMPITTTITTETTIETTTYQPTIATTGAENSSSIPNSTSTTVDPPSAFCCEDIGYFPDPFDCSQYHMCQLYPNGTLWDTLFNCSINTVWCQKSLVCEHPTMCPCELVLF